MKVKARKKKKLTVKVKSKAKKKEKRNPLEIVPVDKIPFFNYEAGSKEHLNYVMGKYWLAVAWAEQVRMQCSSLKDEFLSNEATHNLLLDSGVVERIKHLERETISIVQDIVTQAKEDFPEMKLPVTWDGK